GIRDFHVTGVQTCALPISIRDSRGYFSRNFCRKTLQEHGISFEVVQANTAYNKYVKTLRGMHYQLPPYSEEKIITCTQGSIYDVDRKSTRLNSSQRKHSYA